jgi:phosphate transport system permease protein
MTQSVTTTDQPVAMSMYRTRRTRARTSLLAHGEPMVWLTGGALVVCIAMIVGLLSLVVVLGLSTFWPGDVVSLQTVDGRTLMGEVTRRERYTPPASVIDALPEEARARAQQLIASQQGQSQRMLIRTGNFEITGEHFTWVSDFEIVPASQTQPAWVLLLERTEWGRFYGQPAALLVDGEPIATEPADIWAQFQQLHPQIRNRWQQRRQLEQQDIGQVNHRLEAARLARREVELEVGAPPAIWMQAQTQRIAAMETLERAKREQADASILARAQQAYDTATAQLQTIEQQQKLSPHPKWLEAHERYLAVKQQADVDFDRIKNQIASINQENARYVMTLTAGDGTKQNIELVNIVRAFPPNQLSGAGKLRVYLSRWGEFLFDEPREANSEGGVWPAIVGTVLMTIVMALVVVPFGVLAALYLREYAKAGPIVSAVRIAVNNLAGVPSIVFGVFGLGFFCYIVGAYIDGGPQAAFHYQLPSLTWFMLLTLLAGVVMLALVLMLASRVRPGQAATSRQVMMRSIAMILWVAAAAALVVLVATVPFFDGFYRAKLADGSPTFRKGALVWASFTLALLTLPVVIVATEEALAAVPRSMREGSYACGASKWQTIRRIVLPRAMPGIMTGMILAMARGAGEVAPLMLVGAVKLAPELPLGTSWPFVHPQRSFMHLGFHIFDLGFQSQNSEAAKPVVFTTTLLLITLIAALNLSAIWIRSRLKRRFAGSQF